MQALQVKRLAVQRMGMLALALGTLVIGLVGATMLRSAAGHDTSGAIVVAHSAPHVTQLSTLRFLEANTQLPAAAAQPALSMADWRFAEANQLPVAASVTTSMARTRFLEQNTYLPSQTGAVTPSLATLRFLELNVLPDAELVPPAIVPGAPS